jgi:hypothetical protein
MVRWQDIHFLVQLMHGKKCLLLVVVDIFDVSNAPGACNTFPVWTKNSHAHS